MVLKAYRIEGNSCTHLPFATSNLFFKPSTITLFEASANSLPWKKDKLEIILIDPIVSAKLLNLFTFELSSVARDESLKNAKSGNNIFQRKVFKYESPMLTKATTSNHLVK